jgi:hypothetical protein
VSKLFLLIFPPRGRFSPTDVFVLCDNGTTTTTTCATTTTTTTTTEDDTIATTSVTHLEKNDHPNYDTAVHHDWCTIGYSNK